MLVSQSSIFSFFVLLELDYEVVPSVIKNGSLLLEVLFEFLSLLHLVIGFVFHPPMELLGL